MSTAAHVHHERHPASARSAQFQGRDRERPSTVARSAGATDRSSRASPKPTASPRKRRAEPQDKDEAGGNVTSTPGAGPSSIQVDIRPTYERPDDWKTLRFKRSKRAEGDGERTALAAPSAKANAATATTARGDKSSVAERPPPQPERGPRDLRDYPDRHSDHGAERRRDARGPLPSHYQRGVDQGRSRTSYGNGPHTSQGSHNVERSHDLRATPMHSIPVSMPPTPMSMSPAFARTPGAQSPAPATVPRREGPYYQPSHSPYAYAHERPPHLQSHKEREIERTSTRATPRPKSPPRPARHTPGLATPTSLPRSPAPRATPLPPLRAPLPAQRVQHSQSKSPQKEPQAQVTPSQSPRKIKPLPTRTSAPASSTRSTSVQKSARSQREPSRESRSPSPISLDPRIIMEMVEGMRTPTGSRRPSRASTPCCVCCDDDTEDTSICGVSRTRKLTDSRENTASIDSIDALLEPLIA